MDIKIAPSLLSADFANLATGVREVEAGGAQLLHFDIMDGHFVPNISFGPMVISALRPISKIWFDAHLMIYNAEDYIDECVKAGANAVTVHAEACTHLHRVIQQIKSAGVEAGVALNPATPLSAIEYVMADIDSILVMTVNPGFGGQGFIESMLPKISEARKMVERTGRKIDIAVDGGIDLKTCRRVVEAGANVLVAGSSVFKNSLGASEAVRSLQSCASSGAEGR